jgi:archaeosortase C (PEF-CTERM variant)
MPDYKNIIIFLLIFALFLGATIEISEGSAILGILLFVIAILLISRIKVGKSYVIKQSKLHMFLGALIVAADIAYNVLTTSELGTLDIMTFLLGISLIAYDINNEEIRRMGKFGAYMSATFIALFLFFFELFNILNIDFTHTFDHYFVLLPSVFIINAIGIPIQVISTETVRIQGVEDMSVIIGGPCSGLYSMFLLIGIMVAYTRIEDVKRSNFFALLLISVIVAYIANLTRVITLYIVGFYYGKEMLYFVHVHLGWIIFVIVVAVLLYLLDRMAR